MDRALGWLRGGVIDSAVASWVALLLAVSGGTSAPPAFATRARVGFWSSISG